MDFLCSAMPDKSVLIRVQRPKLASPSYVALPATINAYAFYSAKVKDHREVNHASLYWRLVWFVFHVRLVPRLPFQCCERVVRQDCFLVGRALRVVFTTATHFMKIGDVRRLLSAFFSSTLPIELAVVLSFFTAPMICIPSGLQASWHLRLQVSDSSRRQLPLFA